MSSSASVMNASWLVTVSLMAAAATAVAAPPPHPAPAPSSPTSPTSPADPTPASASIDLDATLPPELATGTFQMRVTVDNVPAALVKNADGDPQDPVAQFGSRVVVKLPDVDATDAVPAIAAGGTAPDDATFVVSEYQPHDEMTNDDGTHFYEYYVQVTEATAGALAKAAATGQLSVSVGFYLGGHADGDLVVNADNVKIDQEPDLRAATPDTPGAIPVKGGLELVWQPKPPVHAVNGKTYPAEPENVNVYVISPDYADGTRLPAKLRGDDGDTPAFCTLYPGPGLCVDCPDDGDYYLDATAIAKINGMQVLTVPVRDGLATVSSLKAGGKYEVFMQYAPDNLNVSQCMFAYPQ